MSTTTEPLQSAGVFRRLAAMTYDSFLIAATLIVAAVPPVLINGGAIIGDTPFGQLKQILFFIYLVAITFGFYGWFWTHRGQTLGMMAWKIMVISQTGDSISWRQSLLRAATSLLGIANLWCWLDSDNKGWHEHISLTKTIYKPYKSSPTPQN